MLIDGLIPANPKWIRSGNVSSTWSDAVTGWKENVSYNFPANGAIRAEFENQPGTKTRIEIDFRFAYPGDNCNVYLLTSNTAPPNVPSEALASAAAANTTDLQTIVFDNVSISAESYYVCFLNTGGHKGLTITAARAVTSYTVYSQIELKYGPTSGQYQETSSYIQFGANITQTVGSYNPFTFANATLHWRTGTIGSFYNVEMELSENNTLAAVYIPGNTFSEGVTEWYISAVDNTGEEIESALLNFRSYNRYFNVIPETPNGSLVGNNEPVIFAWRYNTATSIYRSQCDLQYSQNNESWTNLASVPVTDRTGGTYTVPANTFPPGFIYWRIRVIGNNGGVGNWSESVSFEAIGASVISNFTASAVPFSTLTWEVEGELAYNVMVDDKIFGPYRDPDAMSYTLTEPLSDGEHILKVRAQNKYGLWSAFTETTVSITNVPGAAVVITGEATSNGAELTITGGEQTGLFLVYRDDAHVARTPARLYKDRTALGRHEYYVIQAIADGYYTKSNTVEVVSAAECPEIALLSGGDFLMFGYSDSAYPEINVTRKTNTVKTHYSGAKFPTVETGEQEELSVSFGTFWLAADSDAAEQLEAMQGKAVILKYPPNHVLVGVLDNLPGVDFGWKRAYTIYLEQMEWRDFTDES